MVSKRKQSNRRRRIATVSTVARVVPRQVNNMPRRSQGKNMGAQLTQDGARFLKTAFAAPDQNSMPFMGIPDKNNATVVVKRYQATNSVVPTAGKSTFIVVAPVPGISHFYDGSVDIGSSPITLTSVDYPGATNDFPTNDEDRNFTEFRCGALAAELKYTGNLYNGGGSITCYKIPMSLALRQNKFGVSTGNVGAAAYCLNGLRGVTSTAPKDSYAGHVFDGVYAVASDRTGEFEFNPIIESLVELRDGHKPIAEEWPATTIHLTATSSSVNIAGFGNTDAIVFKIDSGADTQNSFILRTWAAYEFKPSPYGQYMDLSSLSPSYDPMALRLYDEIRIRLPTAVIAKLNAGFWQRVLSIIRGVSRGLSFVPGPTGVVAGGINTILSVLE
jgi:hypothetical protein